MDLEQKLEKLLLERYGITREGLDEAIRKEQEVDLGIFVMPLKRYEDVV